MFLHAGFDASGKGKNRYFAGYDKMFPGTHKGATTDETEDHRGTDHSY
jgi:hypothetical protein